MKPSLLLLLLSSYAFGAGRLELFHAPSGQPEQPIPGTFEMFPAKVTDISTVRFRVRNVGDAAVTLTKLDIAGTGFSSTGAPSLPHIVAPGTNVDFTIRFSPSDYGSYSGLLSVNAATYVIKAIGEAAVALLYNDAVLRSGDTIDFGRVETGVQASRTIVVRNTTREPLIVARSTITGPNFTFAAGPPAQQVAPGESSSFSILFRATSSGVYKETLTVDRREFSLTASVTEPPLPRPTISIESSALRSGQQGRIAIRLAQASRVRARGTIRMELQPNGQARDNDDAARFVNGSRLAEFTIADGDAVVRFGSDEALTFQTGTTAGTIVFTVEAGGFTDRGTIVVEPEAVRLEKAAAVRTPSGVRIQLTGFDNTRTVEAMNFNFHLASGQSVPVRVPVGGDFGRWWVDSRLGGIFSFSAAFPISGDASQVKGVDVEVTNSRGTIRTERLSF